MQRLRQDVLISGLYRMLHPFLGDHARRKAVRIAPASDYAEKTAGVENWKNAFKAKFDTTDPSLKISLRHEPFTWGDGAELAGVLLALAVLRSS
ncbi:MAG: hypothetical protein ACREUY_05880 [Burkholderiales bacterium]